MWPFTKVLDVVTMCRSMASFGKENFKDKNFPKGFSSVFNIKCKMVLREMCDDWDYKQPIYLNLKNVRFI